MAQGCVKRSSGIRGIEQDVKPKCYPDLLAHYDHMKYQADHMYRADPKMYKEQI